MESVPHPRAGCTLYGGPPFCVRGLIPHSYPVEGTTSGTLAGEQPISFCRSLVFRIVAMIWHERNSR